MDLLMRKDAKAKQETAHQKSEKAVATSTASTPSALASLPHVDRESLPRLGSGSRWGGGSSSGSKAHKLLAADWGATRAMQALRSNGTGGC